jgi:hypothetical protein
LAITTSSYIGDEQEEQQVDFDFCDPSESDFHIVKALVQRMLDGADFDSSAFTDLFIDQVRSSCLVVSDLNIDCASRATHFEVLPSGVQAQISTSLRCGDDCVGLAALLPLSLFSKVPCIQQILTHWRKHADHPDRLESLLATSQTQPQTANNSTSTAATGKETKARKDTSKDCTASDVSLFVSERVLNAPPELATPLLAGLVGEMRTCAASDDAELQAHGRVGTVVHCALAYLDSGAAPSALGAVPVTTGDEQRQTSEVRTLRHP